MHIRCLKLSRKEKKIAKKRSIYVKLYDIMPFPFSTYFYISTLESRIIIGVGIIGGGGHCNNY